MHLSKICRLVPRRTSNLNVTPNGSQKHTELRFLLPEARSKQRQSSSHSKTFAESTANIIVDPLDVESRSPCLVSKCYECTLMKDTAWKTCSCERSRQSTACGSHLPTSSA